jgi:hypothetical protein
MSKQVECQNGHAFEVGDHTVLPYRCPRCDAPSRPVRPYSKIPRAGLYGERQWPVRVI